MIGKIKQLFNLIFAWKTEEKKGKNPIWSKTIWANIIAIVAGLLSEYVGIKLSAEEQLIILSAVNIFLRMISKSPVGFYELSE